MSNKTEITQFIKERINQNISKSQIETELSSKYQNTEYEKILKDFPEPALKEKYKNFNRALIVFIAVTFLIRLINLIKMATGGMVSELGIAVTLGVSIMILSLPVVAIYLVSSYSRRGYIFTTLFYLYALQDAYKSMTSVINLFVPLIIVMLSVFLYRKIFPKTGSMDGL
jgi:ABC-type multidrug transport system fused ATPase/permease subunit